MKTSHLFLAAMISLIAFSNLGMARNRASQYDEEARQEEQAKKDLQKKMKESRSSKLAQGPKNMLKGVKQATVDSTAGLISNTAQGDGVTGTVEGARQGTGTFLDNTVKGVSKVATLGYGEVDNYTVEQPEEGSGEPTKIKIKIPGT